MVPSGKSLLNLVISQFFKSKVGIGVPIDAISEDVILVFYVFDCKDIRHKLLENFVDLWFLFLITVVNLMCFGFW